jgi:hypothetical protein
MSDCCTRHPANLADGRCRECQDHFCSECLVFPFGEERPPMCIGCALAFSGVRRSASGGGRRQGSGRRFGRRKPARAEPVLPVDDYVFDPDEPLFSPTRVPGH